MADSLSSHIVDLSRSLIDDIELSRLPAEQLLLKAARLARLVDDQETAKWLRFELNGYYNDPASRALMLRLGRLDSADAQYGYFQPFAGISGAIESMQTQIQQLKVPDIQFAPSSSNPNEFVTGWGGLTAQTIAKPAQDVLQRLQTLTTAVTNMASIRSRVLYAIHDFATRIYYERAFAGLAESIFEKHKTAIDELLRANAGDVLEKIPAIYDRLTAGDQEAVSQALNSVRRMIKAFADAVYPPAEGTVELSGQSYDIGSDKVLNRIKLFLNTRCPSESRSERLNKNLRKVHERASAGAHADVTTEEAQALFLQCYLTLGEILSAASAPEAASLHVKSAGSPLNLE
jgi:hypothetical protein